MFMHAQQVPVQPQPQPHISQPDSADAAAENEDDVNDEEDDAAEENPGDLSVPVEQVKE